MGIPWANGIKALSGFMYSAVSEFWQLGTLDKPDPSVPQLALDQVGMLMGPDTSDSVKRVSRYGLMRETCRAALSYTAAYDTNPPTSGPTPANFRSRSQTQAGTTADCPQGTASGDLLLAICTIQWDAGRTVNTPSGWEFIGRSKCTDTSGHEVSAFYRIAGGSEPSTYTFTNADFVNILRFSEVDVADPIAGFSVDKFDNWSGNTVATNPGFATTNPAALVVGVSSSGGHVYPSSRFGRTVIFQGYGQHAHFCGAQTEAGTSTFTSYGGNGVWATIMVGINGTPSPTAPIPLGYTSVEAAAPLVLTKPDYLQEGDALLAVFRAPAANLASVPSGFTLLVGDSDICAYLKIAGASEPSTYTFTPTGGNNLYGVVQVWQGVDPAAPLAATPDITSGISMPRTSAVLTTTVDEATVAFYSEAGGGSSSDNTTRIAEYVYANGMAYAYVQTTAGATTAMIATTGGSAWRGVTIAFAPIPFAVAEDPIEYTGSLTETVTPTVSITKRAVKTMSLTEAVAGTLAKGKVAPRTLSMSGTVALTLSVATNKPKTVSLSETGSITLAKAKVATRTHALSETIQHTLAFARLIGGAYNASGSVTGTPAWSKRALATTTCLGTGVLDDVTSGQHIRTQSLAETIAHTLSRTPVHMKALTFAMAGTTTPSSQKRGVKTLTFTATENLTLTKTTSRARTATLAETVTGTPAKGKRAQATLSMASTGTFSPAVSARKSKTVSMAETVTGTGTTVHVAPRTGSITETLSAALQHASDNGFYGDLIEEVVATPVYVRQVSKTLGFTEAVGASLVYTGRHARTLTLAATIAPTLSKVRSVARTVSMAETITGTRVHTNQRSKALSLTETAIASLYWMENAPRVVNFTLTSTLTPVTVARRMSSPALSGVISGTEGGHATTRPKTLALAETLSGVASSRKRTAREVQISEQLQGWPVVDSYIPVRYNVRQVVLGEPTYVLVEGAPAAVTAKGRPHKFKLRGHPD